MKLAIEPASVMPSSRIWPIAESSEYESSRSWSTGSYFWPWTGVDLESP